MGADSQLKVRMSDQAVVKEPITLCITAGGRPDLLGRTIRSLFAVEGGSFSRVIIANDAGDRATSTVAKELCPDAMILHHRFRIGQHATIDEMYSLVTTPLIFHCEDDWEFAPIPFIERCREVLSSHSNVSVVCARDYDPLPNDRDPEMVSAGRHSITLPNRDAWTSFTFNPSLLRRELWESLGGYRQFNREKDIDIRLQALGWRRAHLKPGVCVHIGDERHVVDPFRKRGNKLRDGLRLAKYRAVQALARALGRT